MTHPRSANLAVATALLHVRLNRLQRDVDAPQRPKHLSIVHTLVKYESLRRRLRAQKVAQ